MAVAPEKERHYDAPESEDDRYAIYTVNPKDPMKDEHRRRLCCTSREGIGLSLETMLDEGEVPRGWRVAVLDRETRRWLVNPFV